MSKSFEIIELDNSLPYKYLVVNKNTISISSKMKDIAKALKKKSFMGEVLFNCLTICRDAKKSYSSIYFDGESFKASTWQDVYEVDEKVIGVIKDFFNKNVDLLDEPGLPEVVNF